MPILRSVRIMRQAMAPRLATSTLLNMPLPDQYCHFSPASFLSHAALQKIKLGEQKAARILAALHTAWVVGARRRNAADAQFDGLGRVLRVRIQRMWAGVQNHQRVHLRTQIYRASS